MGQQGERKKGGGAGLTLTNPLTGGVGRGTPGKGSRTAARYAAGGQQPQASAQSASALSMTPAEIDFGRRWLGKPGPREIFRLDNVPDGDLEPRIEPIGEPDNAQGFVVDSLERAIRGAVGGVDFSPMREGSYAAWLIVRGSDGSEAKTLLKGEGYETPEASGNGALDIYGHERPLTTESPFRTVVVRNNHDGAVTIDGLEPSVGRLENFKFHLPGMPIRVEPGASVEIGFEFIPVMQEEESSLTFALNTSQGMAEFTVVGKHEKLSLFDDELMRIRAETKLTHVIGFAADYFSGAVGRHQDRLREIAEQKKGAFFDLILDVAIGLLLPGIGSAVIDKVVKAIPEKTWGPDLAKKIVAGQGSAVSKLSSAVKTGFKEELMSVDTSSKEAWLAGFKGKTLNGFKELGSSALDGVLTDAELLAAIQLYDSVDEDMYYAKIGGLLDSYAADVESLGSMGQLANRAVWIERGGERRLAVGIAANVLTFDKKHRPPQGFMFDHWVAPEMQTMAIAREEKFARGPVAVLQWSEAGSPAWESKDD